MSSPTEDASNLIEMYKKLLSRACDDQINYESVTKMIAKRAELEVNFAQSLLGICTEKFDHDDSIQSAIVEEVKNESAERLRFAKDLNTLIVDPSKVFITQIKDREKSIDKTISKELKSLEHAMLEYNSSEKNLEAERAKANSAPPAKRDSAIKKAQKAEQEAASKKNALDQACSNSKSTAMQGIQAEFKSYDGSILKRMENNAKALGQLKKRLKDQTDNSLQAFQTKMGTFDAGDRSGRFIQKTFDPNGKPTAAEPTEVFAYAITDYNSEEPKDLQFHRGDKIKVLLQHSSGWWDGEMDGKKGYFPSSYVMIPSKEAKAETIDAVFLCKKDWNTMGDLKTLSGDLVFVDYIQNEKCNGKNLRTEENGSFPLSILEQKI